MARIRALSALIAFLAFAVPASAQSLQRLTVTQLTLSTNQAAPQVEVPFDLVVTAHVRERIAELRNVDLPVLSELELLGDEHTLVASAGGTTYSEHIRVVAHHSGTITIAPATLDAIDARDGKAKRYSSNSLTIEIHGGVSAVSNAADAVASLVNVLRWVFGIAIVLFVVWLLFRRRRKPLVQPLQLAQPAPAPRPAPAITREQRLRDARTVLQAEPTRANVVRVRTMVREMVGANDDETLSDVLRRTGSEDRAMRALLVALERAAFTHDDDLHSAVDDVLDRLNEAA